MSIALVITRGFGNASIVGAIKDLVTAGYGISEFIPSTIPTATGIFGSQSSGIGLNTTQSTGNGIMGNNSTGLGIKGPRSL